MNYQQNLKKLELQNQAVDLQKMIKLGVNIDHVATIRNARGENYPNPYNAAILAIKSGANSITIHLREDRRHIRDEDLFRIARNKKIKLNLEMAATTEMLMIALNVKPNYVCLVPEKRKEITTEGGLSLKKNFKNLKKILTKLKKKNIRTSLFIDPTIENIKKAKELGANCVELHTGKFCHLINNKKNYKNELIKIKNCANFGNSIGMDIHAGHGLNYSSTKKIVKIKYINELNIGHFIISNSIFYGLKKVIGNFKKILNK